MKNGKEVCTLISIHAPSRERLPTGVPNLEVRAISIHAPSRERRTLLFQLCALRYFNPRSLAGATYMVRITTGFTNISIHAPSRERHQYLIEMPGNIQFQSTLPRGSDLSR